MKKIIKNKKLAIVIPAYKAVYLGETLKSISNQTNKDFTVYIADDASPYPIYNIVTQYLNDFDIVYKRFDNNLGSTNLVAHWTRSIELVGAEDWIWLFSDDDIMEKRCVETFYAAIHETTADVLHFDMCCFTDKLGKMIQRCNSYPQHITAEYFYYSLYRGRIDARMPEFVFRRNKFLNDGSFISFDLAWRSDNATVIKHAIPNGIYTIKGIDAYVLWRYSNENISSNINLCERKNNATVDFFNWIFLFFKQQKIKNPFSVVMQIKVFVFSLLFNNKTIFSKSVYSYAKRSYIINSKVKIVIYYLCILYKKNKIR